MGAVNGGGAGRESSKTILACNTRRQGGVKVLCVDDEPDLLYLFTLVLTNAGHEVVQATNGEEALARIAEVGLPDIVVTDLMMPVMDGLALIEHLRADPSFERIPILLVTATLDARAPADAIVSKTDGPYKLLDMVEQLGQRGVA
jgi:CheY-like chemotaxis protein